MDLESILAAGDDDSDSDLDVGGLSLEEILNASEDDDDISEDNSDALGALLRSSSNTDGSTRRRTSTQNAEAELLRQILAEDEDDELFTAVEGSVDVESLLKTKVQSSLTRSEAPLVEPTQPKSKITAVSAEKPIASNAVLKSTSVPPLRSVPLKSSNVACDVAMPLPAVESVLSLSSAAGSGSQSVPVSAASYFSGGSKTGGSKAATKTSHQLVQSPSSSRTVSTASESSLFAAAQREQRLLRAGNRDLVSPLQVKRRLRKRRAAGDVSVAHSALPSGSGVVGVEKLEAISKRLKLNAQLKHSGMGLPTVVSVHPKFIAVGTSRSLVLVFDHFQEMRVVLGKSSVSGRRRVASSLSSSSGGADSDSFGPVTAVDVSLGSDYLVCGYECGRVALWDLVRGTLLKAVTEMHSCAVVSLRYWKPGSVVSVDSRGMVNLITFSKMFMMHMAERQCLLDGAAGQIVAMCPAAPRPAKLPSPARSELRLPPLLSLSSSSDTTFMVQLEPTPKIVFRWNHPTTSTTSSGDKKKPLSALTVGKKSKSTIPCLSWGWSRARSACNDKSASSVQAAVEVSKSIDEAVRSPDEMSATLARGWGNWLQLLQAVVEPVSVMAETTSAAVSTMLVSSAAHRPSNATNAVASPNSSGDVATEDDTRPRVQFVVVAEMTVPGGVAAIEWLDNKMLLYLSHEFDLCVFDTTALAVIESTSVKSAQLVWTTFPTLGSPNGGGRNGKSSAGSESLTAHQKVTSKAKGATSFQNSFRACGGVLYLLGISELRVAKVQSWSQRVAGFVDAGEWLEALALVLDRYELSVKPFLQQYVSPHGIPRVEGQLADATDRRVLAAMPKDVRAVALRVPELLLEYCNLATKFDRLSSSEGGGGGAMQIVGGVCIEYCVVIERTDLLFGPVYSRFEVNADARCLFLELLEPYILHGRLRRIAPVVLRAFVEHYQAAGRLKEVEQCILHLDPDPTRAASDGVVTDLDGLIRLCRTHRLYSALTYLYNEGLRDWVSPASVLLDILTNFDDPLREEIGYKLLLYLSHCFTGRGFPRGSTPITEDQQPLVRAELLHFLFIRYLPPPRPRDIQMKKKRERLSPLYDMSYVRLRLLLNVDVVDALRVIGLALDAPDEVFASCTVATSSGDSDNTQGEVLGVAFEGRKSGQPAQTRLCPSRNQMLTSLVELVAPELVQSPPIPSFSVNKEEEGGGDKNVATLVGRLRDLARNPTALAQILDFIAVYMARGAVMVAPAIWQRVITHLFSGKIVSSRSAGARCEVSASMRPPVTQKQQLLATEEMMMEEASQERIVQILKHSDPALYNDATLIHRAQSCGFSRVVVALHQAALEGAASADVVNGGSAAKTQCGKILDAFLTDRSTLYQNKVFDFVYQQMTEAMKEGGGGFGRRNSNGDKNVRVRTMEVLYDALKDATLDRIGKLVEVDRDRTARLVVELLPAESSSVLLRLKDPKLQFAYLHRLVNGDITTTTTVAVGEEQSALDQRESSSERMAELLERSGVEVTTEMQELYIGLLCQFQPDAVYSYLLSNEGVYPLDTSLAICRRFAVTDATAYLLERTGDVQGALTLVLDTVHERLQLLRMSVDDAAAASSCSPNLAALTPPRFARSTSSGSAANSRRWRRGVARAGARMALRTAETRRVDAILAVATGICARNSERYSMEDDLADQLWFKVLDKFVEALREIAIEEDRAASIREECVGEGGEGGGAIAAVAAAAVETDAVKREMLREVLASFVRTTLEGMMGHVRLGKILQKITNDHQTERFGHFRSTIVAMLEAVGYESSILRAANALFAHDLHGLVVSKHTAIAKVYVDLLKDTLSCPRWNPDTKSRITLISQMRKTNKIGLHCSGLNIVCNNLEYKDDLEERVDASNSANIEETGSAVPSQVVRLRPCAAFKFDATKSWQHSASLSGTGIGLFGIHGSKYETNIQPMGTGMRRALKTLDPSEYEEVGLPGTGEGDGRHDDDLMELLNKYANKQTSKQRDRRALRARLRKQRALVQDGVSLFAVFDHLTFGLGQNDALLQGTNFALSTNAPWLAHTGCTMMSMEPLEEVVDDVSDYDKYTVPVPGTSDATLRKDSVFGDFEDGIATITQATTTAIPPPVVESSMQPSPNPFADDVSSEGEAGTELAASRGKNPFADSPPLQPHPNPFVD